MVGWEWTDKMFPFVPTVLTEDEEKKHSFLGQGKSSAPHPIPPFGGGSLPRIPPLKISGSKRGQRFAERTKAGRYRKHLRKRQVLVVRKHPEDHIIQQ